MSAKAPLTPYRNKRDFAITGEPRERGLGTPAQTSLIFVVQRHEARKLHYDLRLEWGGVLVSWAMPKGPSLDPAVKRLAIHVEDHPLDYGSFEGDIPAGQYGAGHVSIWDRGIWIPHEDPQTAFTHGHLRFDLRGSLLQGTWVLFRTTKDKRHWILRKLVDRFAVPGHDAATVVSPLTSTPQGEGPAPGSALTASTLTSQAAKLTGCERVSGVLISHAQRRVYRTPEITKLQLAQYYEAIAPRMLTHVRGRRLGLLRCPAGTDAPCFFQRHLRGKPPPGVELDDGHLVVNSTTGIISLVQRGVVEFHTWGSTTPWSDKADRLTIDLDPDPNLSWKTIVEAVQRTRGLLQALGLVPFLKTTGGKGVHIVSPITRQHPWEVIKYFARNIAQHLTKQLPEHFTTNRSKAQRQNRIFVDYLRNGTGATAIAAFSARARPGAPVAMPLSWEELDARQDLRAAVFNVRNAVQYAMNQPDPWKDYRTGRKTVTKKMMATIAD